MVNAISGLRLTMEVWSLLQLVLPRPDIGRVNIVLTEPTDRQRMCF